MTIKFPFLVYSIVKIIYWQKPLLSALIHQFILLPRAQEKRDQLAGKTE